MGIELVGVGDTDAEDVTNPDEGQDGEKHY
jgi:hypothetical protein